MSPPARAHPRAVDLVAPALYVLLALWITGPLWRHPGAVDPATNTSDPAFFEWALVHATRIFTHGENPLASPQFNAPLGVNLMANTGLLGLTVPLVPVTLLFGPSVSFLLMLVLGLAGTAAAWYWVLSRHVVDSRRAAAIGGGFGGFAPGLVNHANGHPNLVAQFLLPFIAWAVLTLRSAPRVVRRAIILGLLITGQVFLNEELLFLFALALGVFLLGSGGLRPLRPLLVGLATTAGTALVLLAGPLAYQFFGPQHYHGLPDLVLGYGTDLASYPAFAKLSLVGGAGTLAPQPEENSFLGWPLLLALLVIASWLWRRREVRALLLTGVVFAVLSLGATVTWHGHVLTRHGPWSWLSGLPLFDTVVPTRLALLVIPVVAVLLALALDVDFPQRHWWLTAVALVLLPIVPRPLPVVPRPAVPTFFTSGAWHRYVHGDDTVVSADTTVWNGAVDAMRWDTATGQRYRMVSGYFLGPDETGRGRYGPVPRPTAALLSGVAFNGGSGMVTGDQVAQAVADIRFWHAAIIVLTPDAPHAMELRTTLDALIGPGQPVDDVYVWDVRSLR